ncbi:hypothetical protein K504DRAFT_286442 [Pleomassaria siparia CBS 279.74]|uniref:Transmembrane protein n=1 Tax=Pleomassaria siparia CBS 279.74 TaxID=1314801 RepID=A0A6G1K750_9PLEO|nr:hypothetical protein K504DRAFT_286442 [Pleomassaria siparia CBS 279.74]
MTDIDNKFGSPPTPPSMWTVLTFLALCSVGIAICMLIKLWDRSRPGSNHVVNIVHQPHEQPQSDTELRIFRTFEVPEGSPATLPPPRYENHHSDLELDPTRPQIGMRSPAKSYQAET